MHGEVRHSHGDLATRFSAGCLRRIIVAHAPFEAQSAQEQPPGIPGIPYPRPIDLQVRERSLPPPWVAPLALVLLTALVYARSLGVPIHDWDDHVYFFRDVRVEHPSAENVGASWSSRSSRTTTR